MTDPTQEDPLAAFYEDDAAAGTLPNANSEQYAPRENSAATPPAAQPTLVRTPTRDPEQEEALRRYAQEAVQQARAAAAQPTEQTPPVPPPEDDVDPFAGENLDLTPEEIKRLGNSPDVVALLQKVARGAIREYDAKTQKAARSKLAQLDREFSTSRQSTAQELATATLYAQVPDFENLRSHPDYAAFVNEVVDMPDMPPGTTRQSVLARALTSRNIPYLAKQFGEFRRRIAPPDQAAAQTAAPAPAQAATRAAAAAVFGSTSPGASAPPPGMEQLAGPRKLNLPRVEAELMRMSAEIKQNPKDLGLLERFNKLSYAHRAARRTQR